MIYLVAALSGLAVLELAFATILLAYWVIHNDVLHNIEEIKHLLIWTRDAKGSGPSVEEMGRFFAKPALPGDVTFHIPSSLKSGGWED